MAEETTSFFRELDAPPQDHKRKRLKSKHAKPPSQDSGSQFYANSLVESSLGGPGNRTWTSESETRKRKSYECDICGKTFSTYQALGGHKSSHTNKNFRPRTCLLPLFPPAPTDGSETERASSSVEEPVEIDLELRLGKATDLSLRPLGPPPSKKTFTGLSLSLSV